LIFRLFLITANTEYVHADAIANYSALTSKACSRSPVVLLRSETEAKFVSLRRKTSETHANHIEFCIISVGSKPFVLKSETGSPF